MRNKREITLFRRSCTFRDGVFASVCGFCGAGWQARVEDCFSSLSHAEFGAPEEGLLIDRRFARLLAQAAEGVREHILLTAGCVRLSGRDGPCGAVLGDLFTPAKSAPVGRAGLALPGGARAAALFRPGEGGVVFFCKPDMEDGIYTDLERRFPEPCALEQLREKTDGFLWVTDYLPGHPTLNGACEAFLP